MATQVLTSKTHPLRIDTVEAPGGGVIGMTFCPGKKQNDALTGHWQRDLETDLEVIKKWRAAAIVTLMEAEELSAFQVEDIGNATESVGIDWYHLPIRDAHPPEERFENRWVLYGLKLRQLLNSGGRALIHCRGGLGRTGTVAARLLVELGIEPEAAVLQVRAARPGTIENSQQENHVLNINRPAFDEAFVDRALGCLLGGAVGDAFGYTIEFDRLEQIRRKFGKEGLRNPVYENGRLVVSDDTQMTLFTLEGLARAGQGATKQSVLDEIGVAYADWLDTQGEQSAGYQPIGTLAKRPAMRHRRAPGNTCLSALKQSEVGVPERPINNSKGCGAGMSRGMLKKGWRRCPP